MSAFRLPLRRSMCRRIAIALTCAVAAPAALALPAYAADAAGAGCSPTDSVCVGSPSKAPFAAPAGHSDTQGSTTASSTAPEGTSTGKTPHGNIASPPPVDTTIPKTTFWDDLSNFALTWGPLIFRGAIVVLIGMTMRYMPRTKPQEIKRAWSTAKVASLRVSGDSGEFLVSIPGASPRSYKLVKEDGRWKVDDR